MPSKRCWRRSSRRWLPDEDVQEPLEKCGARAAPRVPQRATHAHQRRAAARNARVRAPPAPHACGDRRRTSGTHRCPVRKRAGVSTDGFTASRWPRGHRERGRRVAGRGALPAGVRDLQGREHPR